MQKQRPRLYKYTEIAAVFALFSLSFSSIPHILHAQKGEKKRVNRQSVGGEQLSVC